MSESKNALTLSGMKYGMLTVVQRSGTSKSGRSLWLCSCDCGGSVIVCGHHLKSGNTKSCGCITKNRNRLKANTFNDPATKRLRSIRDGMLKRCYNKRSSDYKYYGERGIEVCDEWRNSFQAFRSWSLLNGYASHLTIDRINNNGDYDPCNCKWSTMAQQSMNKRNSKPARGGNL